MAAVRKGTPPDHVRRRIVTWDAQGVERLVTGNSGEKIVAADFAGGCYLTCDAASRRECRVGGSVESALPSRLECHASGLVCGIETIMVGCGRSLAVRCRDCEQPWVVREAPVPGNTVLESMTPLPDGGQLVVFAWKWAGLRESHVVRVDRDGATAAVAPTRRFGRFDAGVVRDVAVDPTDGAVWVLETTAHPRSVGARAVRFPSIRGAARRWPWTEPRGARPTALDVDPHGRLWIAFAGVRDGVRLIGPHPSALGASHDLLRVEMPVERLESGGVVSDGISKLKVVGDWAWLGTYGHGVAAIDITEGWSTPPLKWLAVGGDAGPTHTVKFSSVAKANELCLSVE